MFFGTARQGRAGRGEAWRGGAWCGMAWCFTMKQQYTFDFDLATVKILPKIEGQWKELQDGTVRVWFSKEQWADVSMLVEAILGGESNLFEEEHDETVYTLPSF